MESASQSDHLHVRDHGHQVIGDNDALAEGETPERTKLKKLFFKERKAGSTPLRVSDKIVKISQEKNLVIL